LLAQHAGQLVEAVLRRQDVAAALRAGRAVHALAGLAVALAHAARLLGAEAEAGDLDLGKRDGDDVLALAADQLALGQVLPEFLLDDAAHDLTEPLDVPVDLAKHRRLHALYGRAYGISRHETRSARAPCERTAPLSARRVPGAPTAPC